MRNGAISFVLFLLLGLRAVSGPFVSACLDTPPSQGSSSLTVNTVVANGDGGVSSVRAVCRVVSFAAVEAAYGRDALGLPQSELLPVLDGTVDGNLVTEGSASADPGLSAPVAVPLTLAAPLRPTDIVYITVEGLDTAGDAVGTARQLIVPVDATPPIPDDIRLHLLEADGSVVAGVEISHDEDLASVTFRAVAAHPSVLIQAGGMIGHVSSLLEEETQTTRPVPEAAAEAVPEEGGDGDAVPAPAPAKATTSASAVFHTKSMSALPDGAVVYVSVTATDVFGNARAHSEVFPVANIAPTSITGISLVVLNSNLKGFGQTSCVRVEGTLADGGKVDLTGADGLHLASSNNDSAFVTTDGKVTSLQHGTSTITASYGDYQASQDVTVADGYTLKALEVQTADPLTIVGVGSTHQLSVKGILIDNGGAVVDEIDVIEGQYVLDFTIDDPAVLSVDGQGLITALKAGTAVVTVDNPYVTTASDQITVTVKDAPPTVTVTSDRYSVASNADFTLTASVEDDSGADGIVSVSFIADDTDLLLVDTTPPFKATIRAPEDRAGRSLKITAFAVDKAGNEGPRSDPIAIAVVAPAPDLDADLSFYTAKDIFDYQLSLEDTEHAGWVTDAKSFTPGAYVVAGVTLGMIVQAEANSLDRVELWINGACVQTQTQVVPVTFHPPDGPTAEPLVAVPCAYSFTYQVPLREAGRSLVLFARGYSGKEYVDTDGYVIQALADTPPTARISSHVDGAAIRDAATHTVTATLEDDCMALGGIVEWYCDGELVQRTDSRLSQVKGNDTGATMGSGTSSWDLSVPKEVYGRTYELRVVITDTAGHQGSSETTELRVQANAPPIVSLTSPVAASSWIAGGVLPLRASVTDDGGSVSVSYYLNGKFVGMSNAGPSYAVDYILPADLAGTSPVVKAVASDEASLKDEAEAGISLVADGIKPAVSIMSPKEGSSILESQNLAVTIGAHDNLKLAKVELYLDDVLETTLEGSDLKPCGGNSFLASHTIEHPNPGFVVGEDLRLHAIAYDATGNSQRSVPVTVSVAAAASAVAPAVEIVYPEDSGDAANPTKFFVGETIDIVTGGIPEGARIAKAQLFVDDPDFSEPALLTDEEAPFQFSYTVPDGAGEHTLAVVVTAADQTTASDSVTIEAVLDSEPPTVCITSPVGQSTLVEGCPADIVAVTHDNRGISQVTFKLETGGTVVTLGSVSVPSSESIAFQEYRYTGWGGITLDSGETSRTVKLWAEAEDTSAGHNTASDSVDIRIVEDAPPSLSLVSPAATASVFADQEVVYKLLAIDDVGVARVDAFLDGQSQNPLWSRSFQGTKNTEVQIPLKFNDAGDHAVVFQVTDTTAQTDTQAATIRVFEDREAPVCRITSPYNGVEMLQSDEITVTVYTQDNLGVQKVRLQVNGEPVGVELTTPSSSRTEIIKVPDPDTFGMLVAQEIHYRTFTTQFSPPSGFAGKPLALTAKASDSTFDTVSAPVSIEVIEDTSPPYVAIASPTAGSVFYAPITDTEPKLKIQASVTATDNAQVASKTLYMAIDGGPRVVVEAPYTISLGPTDTEYSLRLTAEATDSENNTGNALPVVVTVRNGEDNPDRKNLVDQPPTIHLDGPESGHVYYETETVAFKATVEDDLGTRWVNGYSSYLPILAPADGSMQFEPPAGTYATATVAVAGPEGALAIAHDAGAGALAVGMPPGGFREIPATLGFSLECPDAVGKEMAYEWFSVVGDTKTSLASEDDVPIGAAGTPTVELAVPADATALLLEWTVPDTGLLVSSLGFTVDEDEGIVASTTLCCDDGQTVEITHSPCCPRNWRACTTSRRPPPTPARPSTSSSRTRRWSTCATTRSIRK
jgi:hypothetical protein